MDVAKYIGLFLLKNHFCYIHGLGNLELKKKPANHDGTALQAPSYEVILTPGGSIDDNLANFIAINEQTSISKASTSLRDFSTQARADLQAGKEVVIPSLGKFIEEQGKISFVTDPHLQYTPPGIPSLRNSQRIEDSRPDAQQQEKTQSIYNPGTATANTATTTSTHISGNSVNWMRVIIAVIALLVIVAIGVFGYKYISAHHNTSPQAQEAPVYKDTTAAIPKADTAQVKVDSPTVATHPAVNVDSPAVYKMIIGNYSSEKKADKRAEQMKNYGHDVTVLTKDSSTYMIIMAVKCRPVDTTHVKDSLSHIFNPKGVAIY
jgi:hypothetical protein